jgi:hypothetical protein
VRGAGRSALQDSLAVKLDWGDFKALAECKEKGTGHKNRTNM